MLKLNPYSGVLLSLVLAAQTAACGDSDPLARAVPELRAHLTDVSSVTYIVPPGSISGDDIKGHSYIQTDGSGVPVYAPVDMVLTEGTWVEMFDDFGLQFNINKRFRLRLGHITDPRSDIAALIPRDDPGSAFSRIGPVTFAAGELIGTTTGTVETNGFDFGLYDLDMEVNTPNRERYADNFYWTKLNSVCGYAYMTADIRDAYYDRFGTIGGALVPDAPCRTISDVVGGGGLAGEWYLSSHSPDATYRERFTVGIDLGGNAVRVAGLGAGSTIDVVGATDPQVLTEACYSGNGEFAAMRLSSPETLELVMGLGDCPVAFPEGNQRSYER